MADAKGKIKETVGWVTGDREVQAKGRVESAGGDSSNDAEVEQAEQDVRRDEGDTKTP
jgi:uncharacterized protein YjbJ (UPF0337 family)